MLKRMAAVFGGIALIATAWFLGPALAASLNRTTNTVGAGNASVGRCDTDGVTTVYGLNTTNVTSVIVSNIASACGGATMKVTVNNQATTSSGTGTVPGGGGSLTVTVSSIAVTQVMQNEVVIG